MKKTHPYHHRISAEFDVNLRYRGRCFALCHAKYLTAQGMYVETSKLHLPHGTALEIEFHRWGREWRIPARVSGCTLQGISLQFDHAQPDLYHHVSLALRFGSQASPGNAPSSPAGC